jgi:hypothetical protein
MTLDDYQITKSERQKHSYIKGKDF